MRNIEQESYDRAARELYSKQPVTWLYAKAYSETDGDERRAAACYIKWRVPQLQEEIAEEIRREQAVAAEVQTRQAEIEKRSKELWRWSPWTCRCGKHVDAGVVPCVCGRVPDAIC